MNMLDLSLCFSERPKIRMPRILRSRYVRQVGEQVNLVIPFLVSLHKRTSRTEYFMSNVQFIRHVSLSFLSSGEAQTCGVLA